jgi:hypothetical protein
MRASDARFLIIVARRECSLHAQLQQLFEDNDRVEVLFDRRRGPSAVRPHHERRALDVDASLRTFGWAIVACSAVRSGESAERRPAAAVELVRAL